MDIRAGPVLTNDVAPGLTNVRVLPDGRVTQTYRR
ncbi:hypothetical protein Gocc_2691 [Gaiella occulta]|uniref:Uncharacterized protein n=1 Tax=Gaiella occulta TaxID=1002870 RepID=A0A7M2YUZ0_9ACTN|nr:hypothetical protein Gocc_2691 [Gaiella occulta]